MNNFRQSLKLKGLVKDFYITSNVVQWRLQSTSNDESAYKTLFATKKWWVNNENSRLLRAKGLHLNQSDRKLFSKVWKTKVWSDISNNRLADTEHLFKPESTLSWERNNTSLATGLLVNFSGWNENHQVIAQLIANSLSFQCQFVTDYQIRRFTATIKNKARWFISYSSIYIKWFL